MKLIRLYIQSYNITYVWRTIHNTYIIRKYTFCSSDTSTEFTVS